MKAPPRHSGRDGPTPLSARPKISRPARSWSDFFGHEGSHALVNLILMAFIFGWAVFELLQILKERGSRGSSPCLT